MRLYIVMGVSGSGKTTIGKSLSDATGLPFYDADDFHPPANVDKMQRGIPLDDNDRRPWLAVLNSEAGKWLEKSDAILACSALKEVYRELLVKGLSDIQWIVLNADNETIAQRLRQRKQHFFDPDLLSSQFDALELPGYGWHIDVGLPVESIIRDILSRMETASAIGIVGIGVMGRNLALNFLDQGYHVSVYNRFVAKQEESVAADFLKNYSGDQVVRGFDGDMEAFVKSLASPKRILMMVKAGNAVDQVIDELKPLLTEGDILMDGGNSHFRDTERRIELLNEQGIRYLGLGVSGGKEGARHGPALMPGGSRDAFDYIQPMIESVAAKDTHGSPCCAYVGPGGAGHYVKMVHNGIEYAEMQLISEVHLLFRSQGLTHDEIASVFNLWCNGSLESYLLRISSDILNTKDGETHLIDRILDVASHKGTGIWTVKESLDLGIPVPTITSALDARQVSGLRNTRRLGASVYRKGKEALPTGDYNKEFKSAYRTARVINHIIGFELLKFASQTYHYQIELSEIARIWTNGCIIRSKLMADFVQILRSADSHLLLNEKIRGWLVGEIEKLQLTASNAMNLGVPVPALTAAANYFHAMTTAQSGAALIQAQRDYFGQHGFQRVDGESGTLYYGDW